MLGPARHILELYSSICDQYLGIPQEQEKRGRDLSDIVGLKVT